MENKIINILKLGLFTIVLIAAITYVTVPKQPEKTKTNEAIPELLTLNILPKQFELVGEKRLVTKESLIKSNTKSLILVGNHDSIAVIKDLKKYYQIDMPYVMVANISSAPWFIKKWAIPAKLEELKKGIDIPMIYDYDGDMVAALKVRDNSATKYYAYLVDANGNIKPIYEGAVKEGAIDGSMSEEEIRASLKPLYEKIK